MTEVAGPDGFELAAPLNNLGNASATSSDSTTPSEATSGRSRSKRFTLVPIIQVSATINNMGINLAQSGDDDAAIPLLVIAQKIKAATVGTTTRSFGIGEANLAMMLAAIIGAWIKSHPLECGSAPANPATLHSSTGAFEHHHGLGH